VIGAVLSKATGKPLDELARVLLFEPLGIADVEWLMRGATPAPRAVCACDRAISPRSVSACCSRGAWNGTPVAPAAWIEAATAPQVSGPDRLSDGYQVWLGRSLVDGRAIDWTMAPGLGGQCLFIVPALDLVVVVNAGLCKSPLQAQSGMTMTILNRYVPAAVASRPWRRASAAYATRACRGRRRGAWRSSARENSSAPHRASPAA
jgi:CubicO group peptidase (beta-lactamase class C family)